MKTIDKLISYLYESENFYPQYGFEKAIELAEKVKKEMVEANKEEEK